MDMKRKDSFEMGYSIYAYSLPTGYSTVIMNGVISHSRCPQQHGGIDRHVDRLRRGSRIPNTRSGGFIS